MLSSEYLIYGGAIVVVGLGFWSVLLLVSRSQSKINVEKIRSQINQLDSMLNDPQTSRFAVVEADKLLGYILKELGYKGETVAEKMKNSKITYSDNQLWAAHKLRNKIVHEQEFSPSPSAVSKAIQAYKSTFKKLVRGL